MRSLLSLLAAGFFILATPGNNEGKKLDDNGKIVKPVADIGIFYKVDQDFSEIASSYFGLGDKRNYGIEMCVCAPSLVSWNDKNRKLTVEQSRDGKLMSRGTVSNLNINRSTLNRLISLIQEEIDDGDDERIKTYGKFTQLGKKPYSEMILDGIEIGGKYLRFVKITN